MKAKVQVVIAQLGSPDSPKTGDVRRFLKEFLGDPRVVDINPLLWKIILYLFVLPFRPKKSAQAYSRIWNGKSFPLVDNTIQFTHKLANFLGQDYRVRYGFLVCEPRFDTVLDDWEALSYEERPRKLLLIPQFPQYSESTTASVFDILGGALKKRVNIPEIEFVNSYHTLKAFIDLSVKKIEESLKQNPADALVISFHGIPTRRVLTKKDVYYRHCFETYKLIKERVKGISQDKIHITFQSRFGSEEWLKPATDEYCEKLVKNGVKTMSVYCPSFVADCLETTDEIGHELKHSLHEHGCEMTAIACLNDDEDWAEAFAHFIKVKTEGNEQDLNQLFYAINDKEIAMEMPEQKMSSAPLDPQAKKVLKIVFLTLFIDLIGFSIIFPMFPAMARHYLTVDSENVFLKMIFGTITSFTTIGGVTNDAANIVLFGGILGAMYSMLQFIGAPIWGTISDRIGRKPVLMISVFGLFLSYVLWFFSGSFTTLILARLIGGMMGGNISTASAVVADVTTRENRSKGMAFIGIAFALGFILGPAMGGIFSQVDLTKHYPNLVGMGVNPFSTPALIAAVLSLFNFLSIWRNFHETLPEDKRGKGTVERTANIFKLFSPAPYPGVNGTNISHFLFLTAFSGMEFTLTFLAVERLHYTSMDNAYMFIYIGFLIAMVQGGYVRRKANQVGENKMAKQGLMVIIPGLILIAFTQNSFMLYAGLGFLAIGSAMVIPCQTSAVSIYAPSEVQGHVIGVFRSLGSLARVIGPILASLIYWKLGGTYPYLLGAAFLLIPIWMITKLPELKKT
ncbi:MAG: ferrochelatase [Bacteriovoracaceae bacterium]